MVIITIIITNFEHVKNLTNFEFVILILQGRIPYIGILNVEIHLYAIDIGIPLNKK